MCAALILTACATRPSPPLLLAAPSAEAPPPLRTFVPPDKAVHPAVLLLPGCGAPLISGRAALFERYARKLSAERFAAAIVAYPGSEMGNAECASEATPEAVARAVDAALVALRVLPGFDLKRFHIVAWSQGSAGVFRILAEEKRRPGLVSAAVFYPRCPEPASWKTEVTLFMLLGENDSFAPPADCRAWAEKSDGPGPVAITRYAGAGHGFDVDEAGDRAYAAYLSAEEALAFDASTGHQAWLDLVNFLRLKLDSGS